MSDQPRPTLDQVWQTRVRPLLGRSLSVRQLLKVAGLLLFVWMVLSLTIMPGEPNSVAYRNTDSYYAPAARPEFAAKSPMPARVDQAQKRTNMMAGMMGGLPGSNTPGDRAGGPNLAEEVIQNSTTGGAIAKSARADRRIIYTATVDLVTENLNSIEPKLLEMVKAAGGFVAETNQTGASGGQRSATWRVRVPVDEYDGFLQKARTLGEVQSVAVNSQDVTEEFVDVSARVAAKKVQEQRLIDLIKNATSQLDEVLKVESELARVRGEIERMEGRIRFLKDQTELTTITITVKEVKDYQPPEAPTFSTKMRRAWESSILTMSQNTGDRILALVGWPPSLPVYIVLYGAAIWLAVRGWRKIQPLLNAQISLSPNPPAAAPKAPAEPEPTATSRDA